MKKIMMMLAIAAMAYTGAAGHDNKKANSNCGKDDKQVCRVQNGKTSCYKTNYAQNYPVCRGSNGYYICCNGNNATTNNTPAQTLDLAYIINVAPIETHPNTAAANYEANTKIAAAPVANCGVNEKQVCRKGPGNKTECYKTDYAKNYKVCKGDQGYYICCDKSGIE